MKQLPSSRNVLHSCHPLAFGPPAGRRAHRRNHGQRSILIRNAAGWHRATDAHPSEPSPQGNSGAEGPSSSTSINTVSVDGQTYGVGLSAFLRALPACLLLTTLVSARAARADEERSWKPRRHLRRLDERFKDTWAEELVQVSYLSCEPGHVQCPGALTASLVLSIERVSVSGPISSSL